MILDILDLLLIAPPFTGPYPLPPVVTPADIVDLTMTDSSTLALAFTDSSTIDLSFEVDPQ